MRLLAIDTALAACSAAIYDTDTGAITSESLPMVRGHAEALLPLIERVVAAAQVEFSALDRIVVTVGPGSFTGLRVGVAAARGIALAARKRCVGVTTLRALARPHAGAGASVLSVIDARHEHVYFQPFDPAGDALDRARVISIRDVANAAPAGPVRLVGNGAKLIDAAWPTDRPAPLLSQIDAPDIGWVAKLGAQNDLAHELPKPMYLRAPDAKPPEPTSLVQRP